MYGYIRADGVVGELFEEQPPAGTYHPDFSARIEALPEGVTTGWRRDGGQWLPPEEQEPPEEPALETLLERILELEARIDELENRTEV